MKVYVKNLVDIVGSGGGFGRFELFSGRADHEDTDHGRAESTHEAPEPKALQAPEKKKAREVRPHEVG